MAALLRRSHCFKAMGTRCELLFEAADAAQLGAAMEVAEAEVRRLEQKYSRYRDDSIVSRINASAGSGQAVLVDDETAGLLDYAAIAYDESGGLFDVTSGVLRRAWDFRSGRLPDPRDIEALLPLVGWSRVQWSRPAVLLPRAGMELDFGGYVKEYAADAAAQRCRDAGVRHGYVDLGGDISLVGPQADGAPWRIGIRNPRAPERAATTLLLTQGGLATSGDYERYLLVQGQRYCHLLDPHSGWPVQGTYASVSVMAPRALIAGTATTCAMLMGEPRGEEWLRGLGLACCVITQAGELRYLPR